MSIKRLPLYTPPENRMSSTAPDGKLVNCIVESLTGEKAIRTRPGVGIAADGFAQWTQTDTHQFGAAPDGQNPYSGLIPDGAGGFYGTTTSGGAYGYGTIYKTTQSNLGGYITLYSFSNATDGGHPHAALTFDGTSTLYGGTTSGGANGAGTVFKIATDGTGFAVLHALTSATDGNGVYSALALGSTGTLYGVAQTGGANNLGTVFSLTTGGTGFTTLHSFAGGTADGALPSSPLVLDSSGFLYGTASSGGADSGGVLFKLTTAGTGYTVLYSFATSSSITPTGNLALDSSATLYGATAGGGLYSFGGLYKIKTDGTGFVLLRSLASADGTNPKGGLVFDSGGKLYGTGAYGGANGGGTAFRLNPDGSGFEVIYAFATSGGTNPVGALFVNSSGVVYGTVSLEASTGVGSIFYLSQQAVSFSTLGLGMYVWGEDRYSVFADYSTSLDPSIPSAYSVQVYKNGTPFGSPATGIPASELKRFDFVETRGATPRLVFHNSYTSWYTDGTTLSNLATVANYPANLVQGIGYVDGYIAVMNTKAVMYTSALDDPTTWNAADFVTAEIAPGQGTYLTTLINFIVCVKQWSIEFMYDAAVATGSPFAPYSGSKISIGSGFAETVASLDGAMFLLAQSYTGGYFVSAIDNMKPRTISVPAIDRLLSAKPLDPLATYGITFRTDGHAYYALTLGYTDGTNITIVYDATTGMWSEWSLTGLTEFPFRASAYSQTGSELQHASQFFIGLISSSNTADWGGGIPMQIQTPVFDGGNTLRKFLRRFELIGDRVAGGVATVLTSDDDYQTWQVQGSIPLDTTRNDLWQLGSFRRRAFQINLSNSITTRIIAAELEIDEGVR